MRRTLRKFKDKLLALSADERHFALAAMVCAPVVEVSLRTAGLKRTLGWIERVPAKAATADGLAPERAASIIDSVYRLQVIRGRCLPRALLQYGLQRRNGTAVRLIVGVRHAKAAEIDAHAWVELDDGPVEDTDFAPLLVRRAA